jgi:hypothetical protein
MKLWRQASLTDITPSRHEDLWIRRSAEVRLVLRQSAEGYRALAGRQVAVQPLLAWQADDWWFVGLVFFCGGVWGALAIVALLEWRGIL